MGAENEWVYHLEESVTEEGNAKDEDLDRQAHRHREERHQMQMDHAKQRHDQFMRHSSEVHQHNLHTAKEHHKELSPAYLYGGGMAYNVVDKDPDDKVSPSQSAQSPAPNVGTSGGIGNTSANSGGVASGSTAT